MRPLREWIGFVGTRISFGLIVIGFLVLVTTFYWLNSQTQKRLSQLAEHMIDQIYVQTISHFDLLKETMAQLGTTMIHDLALMEMLDKGDRNRLYDKLMVIASRLSADEVLLLDPQGQILAQNGKLPFDADRLDYLFIVESFKQGKPSHAMVRQGDLFVHYTALAIHNANGLKGFLLVGVVIDDAMMQMMKQQGAIDFALVGDRVVMATSMRPNGQIMRELPIPYTIYQYLLKQGGSYLTEIANHPYLIIAKPLTHIEVYPNASLMILYDATFFQSLQTTVWKEQFSALLVVLVLLALTLLWLFMRYYKRNLEGLFRIIDCYRRGESKCKSAQKLDGEYAHLDEALEDMAVALSHARQEVTRYANELEEKVIERTEVLHRRNQFLKGVLEQIHDMVVVIENGRVTFVNQTLLAFFNLKDYETFIQNHLLETILDIRHKELCNYLNEQFQNKHTRPIQLRTVTGEARFFDLNIRMIDASTCSFLLTFHDITDNERQTRQLEKLAMEDLLSGLPNRRMFETVFHQTLGLVERTDLQAVLMIIDIDDFKRVNDTYGHDEGDRVIRAIGKMLKKMLRKSDFSARWGGEEFALIIQADLDRACEVAQKILTAVRNLEGLQSSVTVSIGMTAFIPNVSEDEIFSRADHALYKAKQAGKDRVEIA